MDLFGGVRIAVVLRVFPLDGIRIKERVEVGVRSV
jgi:hypothetical protein